MEYMAGGYERDWVRKDGVSIWYKLGRWYGVGVDGYGGREGSIVTKICDIQQTHHSYSDGHKYH